jgi:hypothetical protein
VEEEEEGLRLQNDLASFVDWRGGRGEEWTRGRGDDVAVGRKRWKKKVEESAIR